MWWFWFVLRNPFVLLDCFTHRNDEDSEKQLNILNIEQMVHGVQLKNYMK